MDLGLRGKKAIVTGATKGIGRAIVELLAAEGADIGFCARNEDEVAEATVALKQRDVNVVGGSVNVRDADAYKAWLESTAEALGGCDIFIPNVSAGAGMDSEKNWWRSFEVDVLHTVRGCETLMERLKASGSGSVVIISSTNALETFGGPMDFEGGAWEMIKGTNPKFYEATEKAMPNRRFGSPEEVARTVAFLASPAASIITGANVVADNGYTKGIRY